MRMRCFVLSRKDRNDEEEEEDRTKRPNAAGSINLVKIAPGACTTRRKVAAAEDNAEPHPPPFATIARSHSFQNSEKDKEDDCKMTPNEMATAPTHGWQRFAAAEADRDDHNNNEDVQEDNQQEGTVQQQPPLDGFQRMLQLVLRSMFLHTGLSEACLEAICGSVWDEARRLSGGENGSADGSIDRDLLLENVPRMQQQMVVAEDKDDDDDEKEKEEEWRVEQPPIETGVVVVENFPLDIEINHHVNDDDNNNSNSTHDDGISVISEDDNFGVTLVSTKITRQWLLNDAESFLNLTFDFEGVEADEEEE